MPMTTDTSMVFAQRWAGFVASVWLMALSGSFGFSNYSTALKEILGLNQEQLNRLSVAKDLGDACGIIAGILCNYLPVQALLCIGAGVGFVGNGIQWLVISRLISPPPYWAMFLIAMLAGNVISWMNTSVFPVSVMNFPRTRGPVVGLFKAYMGLSAAIFSSFCDNFFSSSAPIYLLMMATVPPAFCLIAAIFLRPVPPSETPEDIKAEKLTLLAFNIISTALAVLLVVQNLVPGDIKQGTMRIAFMVLICVSLAVPAFVPLIVFFLMKREASIGISDDALADHESAQFVDDSLEERKQSDTNSNGNMEPLLDSEQKSSRWGSTVYKLGEDQPTLSLFKTWHAYILYITLFCGGGLGITFSNNLGQVGQSFGFSTVTIFTSLFSLGNFFGRISSGNVSEYFLNAKGTPRPVWIGVAKVPMIAIFTWLSMGSAASLYAGSFILGWTHGTVVTLTIPIISEFYGLKYFGTNYMVLNTHLLAGSTIFSGLVAGYLYDIHASHQGDGGALTCYGASCYGTSFLLFAGVLIVALFFDAILTFFSRPLYKTFQDINTHIAVPKHINLE